ncbi:ATP-dependent DNA helicase [Microlunatus parietis]|uniref:ATP-dependent helicase DinG n=1 Tax=Microlunatus parietis TaxID=682979 RepID=A0A7Y9I317_9ACTN|nr:ATP-dependent DNA helicase DinG [Microlunatus parietis]
MAEPTAQVRESETTEPGHRKVLDAAVSGISGQERPGQVEMADAIAAALDSGRHLLVQAGTGTGKSLGYLAPALIKLVEGSATRIVVATATLALQSQLADNDIPAALAAVKQVTGKQPRHAVLKGRTNYACLYRARSGGADDQAALFGVDDLADTLPSAGSAAEPESALGAEVLRLREWIEEEHDRTGLADRDGAPSHSERAWQQVSIPVRECLGVQRCPYGDSCFVERSRDVARAADLIVTNHALLAINAMHGETALPEHDAVIIDEAHELVSRVTGAASAELSPQAIERVGRRAAGYLEDEVALDLLESADALRAALDESPLERIEDPDSPLGLACATVRTAARRAVSDLTSGGEKADPEQRQAAAAVKEIFDIAERMAGMSQYDVIWVTERERTGREACVAPLSVSGLMRSSIFGARTVVLTSATLKLGGDFGPVAASVGLRPEERDDSVPNGGEGAESDDREGEDPEGPQPWRGLDVGSPFDYPRQGILYIATDLPPPGRDGMAEQTLAEIAELVWAAGGRTLGLFSSRRAAEAAATYVRKQLPKQTILCQGDAQLTELKRRFVAEEESSLFGTLSLWQGVDVPGDTCIQVIIDRIPFPRPDDPLLLARQRSVAEAGGNGFMAVAATHAALLLAQGTGRLIRRISDRGLVAVLDPRLATARYGSFLRASLPAFWPTRDREVAVQALRRLTTPPGTA